MIDEGKLIEELNELGIKCQSHADGKDVSFDFAVKNQMAMLHNVLRRIKNQPKVGEWIPCKKAIPEDSYGCIVTVLSTNPITLDTYHELLSYHVGYDKKSDAWFDMDGDRVPFDVIAWMKVPDEYKESED